MRFARWFPLAGLSLVSLAAACAGDPGGRGDGGDATGEPTPAETETPTGGACAPTAGGPYWIEEGENVSFVVSCTTGATTTFGSDELPPGASLDATGDFTWTPGLDAAAVYRFDVRAANGETVRVTIGVADRWDDPANVPIVDPTRYTEEFGLPVFFLSPPPEGDEDFVPTTVIYRGHTYTAEAKKRGVTSIHYPKNSYTLRFAKEDKFEDEERGFDGVRRVALTQTFDDNSCLRNRLAFTLWNLLDPSVKIRAFNAVVYLDGEYWGLYTATDFIDDNLMKDNGLGDDGGLFKALTHEANWDMTWNGAPKWGLRQGFLKKEGLPAHGESGAYDELEDLVALVGTASDAVFDATIDTVIETRDYLHWWVFARMIHAEDSVSKNSFHYLPVEGKWRYIPWDFNASFGQSYATVRRSPRTGNQFTHRNKMFARFLARAEYRDRIDDLYRQALDGPWKLDDLLAIVDGYAAEIERSAKRNEEKWEAEYRSYPSWSGRTDFTTWEEEVAYVREWIIERWHNESANH